MRRLYQSSEPGIITVGIGSSFTHRTALHCALESARYMNKNLSILVIGFVVGFSHDLPNNTTMFQDKDCLILEFYGHHIASPQLLSIINTLTGSKDKFHIDVSEENILRVVLKVNDLLPEFFR